MRPFGAAPGRANHDGFPCIDTASASPESPCRSSLLRTPSRGNDNETRSILRVHCSGRQVYHPWKRTIKKATLP
jgi:hypothetical protein